MKTFFGRKLNNSGSALVVVLVCMLFVGIIASSVLVLTTNNLEISKTGKSVNKTFYDAEGSADEVRTLLQQYADSAMNNAYTSWLQQYTVGEANVGEIFDGLFADELLEVLEKELFGTPLGTVTEYEKNPDGTDKLDELGNPIIKKQTFTYDPEHVGELKDLIGDSSAEWATDDFVIEVEDETVKIKNVSIKYTDADGTVTVVTTDIVFTAKTPTFTINTVKGQNLNSADYALIANGEIRNESFMMDASTGKLLNAGISTNITVNGNMYAGKAISFGNGTVTINADKLVSRGDFNVADNADVSVKGVRSAVGFETYDKLWAKNINMLSSPSSTVSGIMSLQGTAYLSDDLTLGNGAIFTLAGSSSGFYGYSTNNAANYRDRSEGSVEYNYGTPDGSSAIVINGKNVTLDMSAAPQAWIAGKAFVNVKTVAGTTDARSDKAFLEGESLSYKGQQAAYLLPGECIPTIGHNPMSKAEFETLLTQTARTRGYYKDINDVSGGAIDLSRSALAVTDYVDAVTPYRPAMINYGGTDMVYIYLSFKNADMAAKYYNDYVAAYGSLVKGRMDAFGTGTIKMPLSIVNTGNVLTLPTAGSSSSLSVKSSSVSYADSTIINKQIELSTKFSGLCSGLSESYGGRNDKVTDSIINMELLTVDKKIEVKNDSDAIEFTWTVPDSITISSNYSTAAGAFSFAKGAHGTYQDIANSVYTKYPEVEAYNLYLASGNVSVQGNGKGIIICGGNVEFVSGDFTGMIICGGDVIIKGQSTFTTDSRTVSTIIKSSRLMEELFLLNESTGTSQGDGMMEGVTSGLITIDFENWRKN